MNRLDGKVVTFYSYKGGVGRSFLLSNTAALLAQWGYKVLCIDWDLEAPGLHYYFRPYMASPQTGLVEMVLGARDGRPVDPLGHITPVTFTDGSRLDLIAAGGVGGDYIPNVQGIDWDALYENQDFGNVLEHWRQRWIDSYDVVFVDSRTGISDSGGICTAQLPHILAYAFTANQQNVDGVLEVVTRAAKARNGLPYDRARLLTLPLLCRFDMSEEYERAAEWKGKLHPALKPSYDAWVPEGAAAERVLDHCTVPYSAYWSFGEELAVLKEDFRNPQLISYSLASIAALIARNLEDVQLFTESRDSFVDAAIRTGRRGGQYQYDFFICGASSEDEDARQLTMLLAAAGFSSYSTGVSQPAVDARDDLRTIIDTCRHFVLLARNTLSSWQQRELNHFLRQTLEEQTDRILFPIVSSGNVQRGLPSIVQSIQAYNLSSGSLPGAVSAILARVQGDSPPITAAPPDERLFISYAHADRAWAEWVAWQLKDAGYQVELDVWDWRAGDDFVQRLDRALERGRLVALFSQTYFEHGRSTAAEWPEALRRERLVPVRIDDTDVPALLSSVMTPNLSGLAEEEARVRLLQAVAGPLGAPSSSPDFPGTPRSDRSGATGPRLPGSLPEVWNIPPRRANFTGRDDLLAEVRTRLTEAPSAAVLALSGRAGVGKTQLAIEYANRFSGEYEVAWWVDARSPGKIPEQLASLALAMGRSASNPEMLLHQLNRELRTRSRWLLVFDNAEEPAALAKYLPTGDGHVLITSRNPLWHQVATPVEVDGLDRAESMALLRSRSRNLSERDADRLAEGLDDLPLALVQATESLYVFTPDQYLRQLERNTEAAVSDGTPFDYPRSLSTQLHQDMNRLMSQDPAAAALLEACALLAPEPFPLHACDPDKAEGGQDDSGAALVRELSHPRSFRRILTAVERLGLARVAGGSIQVHRLTQAVLRDTLSPEGRVRAAGDASTLLTTAYPGPAADPLTWPRWPDLLPHLLAIGPADLRTPLARYAACDACWYLMDRGDARIAGARLRDLYEMWSQQLGPEAEETMWAAEYLIRAYAEAGEQGRARELVPIVLELRRRRLGEDDPATLRTAANLGVLLADLGEAAEALRLATETLDRQRRVLGEDHPDTLRTAGNLAALLESQGRTDESRRLAEDTVDRQRRVLGENHPDTRHTRDNLADLGPVTQSTQQPSPPPT